MTTYKQLLSRSIGVHVLVTLIYFAAMAIGVIIVSDRAPAGVDTTYYGVELLFPAASAAICIIASLLAVATSASSQPESGSALSSSIFGHLLSGATAAYIGFTTLTMISADPFWLIIALSGILATLSHFGWIFSVQREPTKPQGSHHDPILVTTQAALQS